MKICAYVPDKHAKANYKHESLDTRAFVGLKMVIDSLQRAGYTVEWAGKINVHKYDIVLVSLTSDCDWWPYIAERLQWPKGDYKVIIGGAGLLHISPFLPFADYFVWGRGEHIMPQLIKAIERGEKFHCESIAESKTFSEDQIYRIAQTTNLYPHEVKLSETKHFQEDIIGCPHKCFFCGYTWHRKFVSDKNYFDLAGSQLFGSSKDREFAMLDYASGKVEINWPKLRTTAIDGFSERLRFMVNKRISDKTLRAFLRDMIESDAKPHQIKFYNLCGLPTETEDDWWELIEAFRSTDNLKNIHGKQWSIVLHTTPFRPMPATPLACAPMSYRNYREEFARVLGKGLRGNLIFQGKNLWVVESMGTDGLATVILSAIAHRGSRADTENIIKLCLNRKFWDASNGVKVKTLEKYFDVKKLFAEYTPETLPSRYLKSYANLVYRPIWQ